MRGIEAALQRDRDLRWGPRTIDLDLLLYDEFTIDEAELQVPHPRMSFRRFVIEPAAEIAANWVHPRIGWSLARLREHLLATPPSVALLGDAPRIHELAEMLRAASRQTPIFSAEWSQGQEPMVKAAKLSVLWRPDGRASAADWRGLAGRGPVLSLECRDATIARDEVLVAIAAMA
jgi:2-amino-4-hydroxy-6-hydroxymethyldihydropteridine diphosphokinase